MDFEQDMNWFAVQTKPFRENLAAEGVAELDLEVFLPRIRIEQQVCGVERLVTKPLFSGYFFARFSPVSLDAVRRTRGTLRVVGTRQFPIPLDPQVISELQERVHQDGFVHLETKSFLPGDRVTIEQGPFAGWMGEVEREWNDGRRVMILLETIQQARALVEKRWLKAASFAL